MFKTPLKRPHDTVNLTFVTVGKLLDTEEPLILFHYVIQVGVDSILQRTFLNSYCDWLVVPDGLEDFPCCLFDSPSTVDDVCDPPSLRTCFNHRNCRLVKSVCFSCSFFNFCESCQIDCYIELTFIRFFLTELNVFLLKEFTTGCLKGCHELLSEGEGWHRLSSCLNLLRVD